jgi:hypothetical protein
MARTSANYIGPFSTNSLISMLSTNTEHTPSTINKIVTSDFSELFLFYSSIWIRIRFFSDSDPPHLLILVSTECPVMILFSLECADLILVSVELILVSTVVNMLV